MKTMKFLTASLIVVVFAIFISSCEESDDNEIIETQTSTIKNISLLSNMFALSDVDDETDEEGGLKSESLNTDIDPCLTVTIEENTNGEFWPRNFTLDWGETNCLCFDENYRRGMIHVSMSDFWRVEGAEKTITFDNFHINDSHLEGVKTHLNSGRNDNGFLTFTRTVEDGVLTKPDGTVYTYNSIRVSEWIEGEETFLAMDNVFSVSGNSSGTTAEGVDFTLDITNPLIYTFRCFWPRSGTSLIVIEGESPITLDYGDGECDDIATITVDGVTTEITLRRIWQ